jgi:hypothetical protein
MCLVDVGCGQHEMIYELFESCKHNQCMFGCECESISHYLAGRLVLSCLCYFIVSAAGKARPQLLMFVGVVGAMTTLLVGAWR